MDEEKYIGYLKYSGKLVEEGLLDAKKSAQALIGFDGAIRFFVDQQAPHLTQVDYELPVRVRQGPWEILIPKTIAQWIMAGGGIVITKYLSTAAKKMAEKDFDDVGIKDIFSKALKAIQWVIKIGKHIGNTTKKKFESVKFRNDNQDQGQYHTCKLRCAFHPDSSLLDRQL